MSSGPGTKVISRRDRGTRTVTGTEVRVEELAWNGTSGRSFDVYRTADGECLTDESFDDMPGDDEIAQLILAPRGKYGQVDWTSSGVYEAWACRGCGTAYSTADADMIVDHVQQCDKVDGAGNPVPAAPAIP